MFSLLNRVVLVNVVHFPSLRSLLPLPDLACLPCLSVTLVVPRSQFPVFKSLITLTVSPVEGIPNMTLIAQVINVKLVLSHE